MPLVVYADVLIVLNFIVDYFLLLAVSKLIHRKSKLWRMLTASLEGGLFSLYIFLPQSAFMLELALHFSICFLMAFTAFGFVNLKEFIKVSGVYFTVNCLYAGIMIAVWKIFKPYGMVINNSVVYFDISAIALIICTVIFYFLFILFSKIFSSSYKFAEKCSVTVWYKDEKTEFDAIIDTGNSVSDVFGDSQIIIADSSVAQKLFGSLDLNINQEIKSRYRAIPCTTVSGTDILSGFRCDGAVVNVPEARVTLKNPILAVSKIPIGEGYGIVNPKIFQNVGVEYDNKIQKIYK